MKEREEPGGLAAKEDEVSAEELEEVSGGTEPPLIINTMCPTCGPELNTTPGCGTTTPTPTERPANN